MNVFLIVLYGLCDIKLFIINNYSQSKYKIKMKQARQTQKLKLNDISVKEQLAIDRDYQNQFQKISEIQVQAHNKNDSVLYSQQSPQNNSTINVEKDKQQSAQGQQQYTSGQTLTKFQLMKKKFDQKKIELTKQQKQLLNQIESTQLLQERNRLIEQLQLINNNLSQLIIKRQKSIIELESLKKQTSQNKTTYKQMTEQCRDYQFMLSGDYNIKLTQEIQHEKTYMRQLRKQLWQLNKQMKQPIQEIIKENQEKQKQQYELQLFVMEQKSLLEQKKLKLQQIQRQSDIKKEKTNKLNYREKQIKKLIQMYFDQDYQTIMTKNPKNTQENFQKLKVKKQKLTKVLYSQQSNSVKCYNRRLSEVREIDRFFLQIQEAINECSLKIIQAKQQRQKQKLKNSRVLQKKRQKESQQGLSSQHYGISRPYMPKKLFSLPKFVQKRIVARYPDNNPYGRKRIYTELENSNYFKNQNRQNQSSSANKTRFIQEAQVSNERLKTDSGYGNKFRNTYEYSTNENSQTELQAQKLQILKSLLNQELVQKHKKIKDKKLSFIAQRNYPIMNSMQTNTQAYEQNYRSAEGDHYRQLCDQLGKDKLLIQQDQDIQQLIYQGIGGRI